MSTAGDLIDLTALTEWMDTQSLGQGTLTNPRLLAGGTQNILMQFERDSRSFVLRRPPIHMRDNSNKTMRREAQVLAALSGSNVPHPGFIAACAETDVLGASFYLMEPVAGFNPNNGLPKLHQANSNIQLRMGLSHIEALTALAAVDYQAVGLEGFGRPEGFLKRQAPRWLSQLESYSEYDGWPGLNQAQGIDTITNWLSSNCPNASEPGIIHGDAHIGNVMFANDSGEVAALVDWELATIGDPLIDLGWIIATWPDSDGSETLTLGGPDWTGLATIDELIMHYDKHSPRNLDSISWYGVLGCFKLAVILEGSYARYCSGKASKEVGESLHESAIRLLARARKLIAQDNC